MLIRRKRGEERRRPEGVTGIRLKKLTGRFYSKTRRYGFNDPKEAPVGYFFDSRGRLVQLAVEDIPEWYSYVRVHRTFGYLDAKHVKYLVYSPNYIHNHIYKDDYLYVSYSTPIVVDTEYYKSTPMYDYKVPEPKEERQYVYTGYQYLMWGPDIVNFAKAVKQYGSIEGIEDIISRMEDKPRWFRENFPEEALRMSEYTPEQIKRVRDLTDKAAIPVITES